MKILLKAIFPLMVILLAGCSSEESLEHTTHISLSFVREAINNTSEKNFEKENLPEWLIEYIHHLKPDNARDVAAFQKEWNGEVVYYVYDEYSSCLLCAVFNSNGDKFDRVNNNFVEFWESSPGWEIIYLSKSIFHD